MVENEDRGRIDPPDPKPWECEYCDGQGHIRGRECPECNGTGEVQE